VQTTQATELLAHILDHGADIRSDREYSAASCLDAACRHGRAGNWSQAKVALDAAYHALGAWPSPGTGYDWHCGSHPIQVAAARADRELREALGE
jgi:hypothetical protein